MLTKSPAKMAPKRPAATKPAVKKSASSVVRTVAVRKGINPFTKEEAVFKVKRAPKKVAKVTRVIAGRSRAQSTRLFQNLMASDALARIALVHEGLPVDVLDQAAKVLDVSKTTLFDALSLPVSTMTRRSQSGTPLSSDESDKMDRVAQVFKQAIELFGSEDTAKEWMSTRLPALGNSTPLQLLDSSAGYQMVLNTIGQIAYGAPA